MLTTAAAILVLLGLVHSVLGEHLVFRRATGLVGVPEVGFPPILGQPQSPMPTLRACWHILTVLAFGFAVMLARFGAQDALGESERFVVRAMAAALLCSGVVIGVGTRGKHFGWMGFFAVAALCWLGAG